MPAGAPAPGPGGRRRLSRGAEFLEAWAPRAPEWMGAEGAAAGRGRRVSQGRDAPVPSRMGLGAPSRSFTCAAARPRRGRRLPVPARDPLARPTLSPRGRRGRARGSGPGRAPPEPRGPRAFLPLGLLKSSFPGESGDVRGPASRWRGRPAEEAASSYPITDCQSCRPSPLPGGCPGPRPPPAPDPPGIPPGIYRESRGPGERRGAGGR